MQETRGGFLCETFSSIFFVIIYWNRLRVRSGGRTNFVNLMEL